MKAGWFARVKKQFSRHAIRYAHKPITYVEIGCWEGASARWVCEHVLTHPEARGFGIDPYAACGHDWRHTDSDMEKHMHVAHNVLRPWNDKWTWVRKPSVEALSHWEHGPIDLLYIDGAHSGPYSLLDFCLAWPHLRVGSGVIFDDYAIGLRKRFPHVPECIEAIENTFGNLLKPWRLRKASHKHDQVYFQVRSKEVDDEWYKRHTVSVYEMRLKKRMDQRKKRWERLGIQ